MYKLPIEIVHGMKFDDSIEREIATALAKSTDNYIYKSILNAGINVDKDELLKALNYDRRQYEKGYEDGFEAGIKKAEELFGITFNPNVIIEIRSDNNAE